MENASKALIMAGGVLISLMVIGLLVLFYNNLSGMQKIKTDSETEQQATEFNKQYDVYARDVYGSEILSIANKIADYNKREADNKGYTPIDLEVTFTKGLSERYFVENKVYSAKDLYDITANKSAKNPICLEEYVKQLGNKTVYSRTNSSISRQIKKIATMRTNDLQALEIEEADYKDNLAEYNQYKNLLTQMKETVFKYVKFDYDENNGRIKKMIYKSVAN